MSNLIEAIKNIGKDYTKKNIKTDLIDEPFLIEKLIESIKDNSDVNVKDKKGNNLLHLAAYQYFSNIDLFDLLIKKGVSINEQNKLGQTVLHIVLCDDVCFFDESKVDIINLLIKKGSNIFIKDKKGESPLDRMVDQFRFEG